MKTKKHVVTANNRLLVSEGDTHIEIYPSFDANIKVEWGKDGGEIKSKVITKAFTLDDPEIGNGESVWITDMDDEPDVVKVCTLS